MNARLILQGNSINLLIQGFPLPLGAKTYPRLRIATGINIDPVLWSAEDERPQAAFSQADGYAMEKKLTDLKGKASVAYRTALEAGQLSPERVRQEFEELHGIKKKPVAPVPVAPKDVKLVDVLASIAEKCASYKTGRQYKQLRTKIAAFDGKIKMSELTDAWRERFFAKMKGEGFKENYLWGLEKNLNRSIRVAKDQGMDVRIKTSHFFSQVTPQRPYLDWDALAKLIAHEPSPHLVGIKTIVMAMEMTSIRIGDVWNFFGSIQVRNGINCAAFRTAKKCGKVHPFIMPILLLPMEAQIRRYGLPPKCSDHEIRTGMKKLLKEAGLDHSITPHDCRRGFLTRAIGLSVWSDTIITRIFSGHQLGGGEKSVLHGYDMGDILSKQKAFLRILKNVPLEDVGGIRLI